jgi:hypothetical protein
MKSWLYRLLRLSNDLNAVRRGHIGRRIARRAYGKATGGSPASSSVERVPV